jgi:manganese/zinc/iron transport system permease protein
VWLVEAVHRTRLVGEDTAIGLIFPLLFSIAIILISRYAGDVHLDTDAVLLGEIALAPQRRVILAGWDFGPQAAWVMGAILVANLVFIRMFFKELKLTTFDPTLAAALGFSPAIVHYALMGLVSLTAVGAFDAVGSILVVALMVGPPAAGYLLTDDLRRMIGYSLGIAVLSAVAGYWIAHLLDVSIAGSMAGSVGILFTGVLVLAPTRGIVAVARRRGRQRWDFAQTMLTGHLLNHEGTPEEGRECRVDHIEQVLGWAPDFRDGVISRAERDGLIVQVDGSLRLTPDGHTHAAKVLVPAAGGSPEP